MTSEPKRPIPTDSTPPARRKTADPVKPLARLVQQTLTVSDISVRQLWCLPPTMSARDAIDAMDANGFDVAGVAGSSITHFVRRTALDAARPRQRVKNAMEPIYASQCVEHSLPIATLFDLMLEQDILFVLEGSEIRSLINHSDLSASAVSIAVLAHLAAIEEGLKEIASTYSEAEVLGAMPKGREKAEQTFAALRERGVEVGLLECFFFGDWLQFIRNTPDLFVALGFSSKRHFDRLVHHLGDLRNHTAHGRGILASGPPEQVLRQVKQVLELAAQVWRHVDERQQVWDRFADTHIVHAKTGRSPIAGVDARQSWPWQGSVHVLTAWNPSGIWSSESRNREANQRLEATLHRHGLGVLPVIGKSPDGRWREHSFLVDGLTRQQAADFGSLFGQTAVFEVDEQHIHVVRSDDARIVRTNPRVRRAHATEDTAS